MSYKSSKKLRSAIEWLTFISSIKPVYSKKTGKSGKYKIGFITLTLSSDQIHSDQEIKSKILKPFIDSMCKVHDVEHYVWKAEAQKNGRIHFHVLINKYINHEWIRKQWNNCQEKLGYITRWGVHENPPSTEIVATKQIKDLASYMVKYMCKSEMDKRQINGMIWNSSYKLKRVSKLTIYPESKYTSELQRLKDEATRGLIYGDHATCVYTDMLQMLRQCSNLREAMRQHIVYDHELISDIDFSNIFK